MATAIQSKPTHHSENTMRSRLSLLVPTSFAFVVLGACATRSPPLSENAVNSSAAIRAAEEVGATHNPDSALYLQLAKEEFGQARVMTNQKNRDWAERLMARAQVDAELSLALARSETENAQALSAIDQVKKFKESTSQ